MEDTSGRARLGLLGAALLFSTGGAAIKATTLSGFQVACFRSAVAALLLALLLPAARRDFRWRTLVVACAYASTMVLFVVANKLTTAANTIFLQSTAPLYVLLLSPLLLGERVSRSELGYMAVLGLGLSLFFVGARPPDRLAPNPLLGNVLATAAGATWGLTVLGLRWLTRPDRHGQTGGNVSAVLAGNVLAALACLPLALPVHGANLTDLGVVTYLGAFQIGAAYLLLTWGLRHVSALEASLLLLAEPVLNPIWAWLLHAEAPGPWALAGGVVILGATAVRSMLRARA